MAAAEVKAPPEPTIVWQPEPRQRDFLACPDFEVMYGGAAGGGKTDGLLMDAWCLPHNGHTNTNHRAAIFRKQYKDLIQMIERARALYPLFIPGIKWRGDKGTFTTPAGSVLQFAHCANDQERFDWRGFAWNYLGFEELTLWASPLVYEYLISRCRTTDRTLPRYVRSTTNPDGPGQRWVMQRWAIQEDGRATVQQFEREFEELQDDGSFKLVPRTVRRRFIPARLADNRHLRGTGYRETLMDLPPDEREALLEGKWTGNRVRGAWYLKEMQAARAQGRIRMIPHLRSVPVNTFWDLGENDTTAIVFHQYAQLQNRFLYAYEQSGEYLDHFVHLLAQLATERGFTYGTHYLPHDAEHKHLQAATGLGKSVVSQLRKLMPGARFEIVPRIDSLWNGINQTRAAFSTCWFDQDDCSDLIAALDAYRKKWDSKLEVFTEDAVHDRFSNYADAFRQFGQGYYTPKQGGSSRRTRSGGTRQRDWKTV